jgi:two-component system phosphate regulon sensor histidine kinase PhoR
MTPENRRKLADLIQTKKQSILDEWHVRLRPLLAAKDIAVPELNDEMLIFLDELAERIREIDRMHSWLDGISSEEQIESQIHIDNQIESTAVNHGRQRFNVGYDVVEMVKEFGILCEVVSEEAEKDDIIIGGKGGQMFHFTFNKALAVAVLSFQKERQKEVRERRKEYLSFVMHDLKTPLNAIMVAAQGIEEKVDDPRLVSEMVRIIIRSGQKLDELLQKTINIEKTATVNDAEDLIPRSFELWPVLQSVIDEFKIPATVSNITIHNLVPTNFVIFADVLAMTSVLRNLVSNAIKYTPGGKIVMGVSTLPEKENVQFWVRDNGVGIPEERLQQLFNKVSPDPRQKGSTGIGLFLVRKIVQAHNGNVSVESKVGEGSIFRITLPSLGK